MVQGDAELGGVTLGVEALVDGLQREKVSF